MEKEVKVQASRANTLLMILLMLLVLAFGGYIIFNEFIREPKVIKITNCISDTRPAPRPNTKTIIDLTKPLNNSTSSYSLPSYNNDF